MRKLSHGLEVLAKEEVEAIRESALTVLETVGFRYRHGGVLKMFERCGCPVDYGKEVVKLPRALVEETVRKVPKDYAVQSASTGEAVRVNDGSIKGGMCYEILFVDYERMERRYGLKEDCVKAITLGNNLDNIDYVMPFVVPSDAQQEICDAEAYKLLIEYSKKPGGVYVSSIESARAIIEMAKAACGGEEELRKRRCIGYGAEPSSPLQLSNHAINIVLEFAKYDLPVSATGSMVMLGATGPATVAGSLVLLTAEVLAGIAMVYLINPNEPASFSTSIHVMDPFTALCTFGSPEQALAGAAGIQVARSFGLSAGCNVGLADSNLPDFQAGFEKALGACLAIAAGAESIGAQGIVGADQGCSYEQLAIDDEWLGMISRLFQGVEVTPETLAVDVIQKVGVGGNFIRERHTLRHARKELWLPKLFKRERWDSWVSRGAKDSMERAREKVRGILKENYPPTPVLDRDAMKQIEGIMRAARKRASPGTLGGTGA
ncbi:MAG: trimethylamine methyltransferase family protein [Candidatus Brockarchaeota archaeon]|nr:trimethylamine methyltransferase family protein [Candidatus Brockarchaeota archaeon]